MDRQKGADMSKKLISLNPEAEAILNAVRSKEGNVSKYVCDCVVMNLLPLHVSLRVESMFLLDFYLGRPYAKNTYGNVDLDEIIRMTLGRAIGWLRDGHRIKNCEPLTRMIKWFDPEKLKPGVDLKNLSEYSLSLYKKATEKYFPENAHGVGANAMQTLIHWKDDWDCSFSYELLYETIDCSAWAENEVSVFDVLLLIKDFEQTYIGEIIDLNLQNKQ